MKDKEVTIKNDDEYESEDMFEKFQLALEMDSKGTPRSTIIYEIGVSSATFYKWIKNPQYWADRYKAKPERLKRATKDIVASLRQQDSSVQVIKGLLKDLNLNAYEFEFAYNYIHKRNSTEAMLQTLPPDVPVTRKAAKIKALKMLQRPAVKQAIDRVMQWELEGIHVTLANDIVSQLYHMAFYDPAMFLDGQGRSRFDSLDDIPEEYRCCVSGMKKVVHPKDPNSWHMEIQLADRAVARKELMEYAHMYEDNSSGLKSLGEGLKKIGEIMQQAQAETIPGKAEPVPASAPGAGVQKLAEVVSQ